MNDIKERIKRHLENKKDLKDMNGYEQMCFLVQLNEDLIASNALLLNHVKLLADRVEILEEQLYVIENKVGVDRVDVIPC